MGARLNRALPAWVIPAAMKGRGGNMVRNWSGTVLAMAATGIVSGLIGLGTATGVGNPKLNEKLSVGTSKVYEEMLNKDHRFLIVPMSTSFNTLDALPMFIGPTRS